MIHDSGDRADQGRRAQRPRRGAVHRPHRGRRPRALPARRDRRGARHRASRPRRRVRSPRTASACRAAPRRRSSARTPSWSRRTCSSIVGPAIGDNALVATPLADAACVPTIHWAGTGKARSEWMFHLQVGSHEDEATVLVRQIVAHRRAQRRARVRPLPHRQALRGVPRVGVRGARARHHRAPDGVARRRRRERRGGRGDGHRARRARVPRARAQRSRGRGGEARRGLGRAGVHELGGHVRSQSPRSAPISTAGPTSTCTPTPTPPSPRCASGSAPTTRPSAPAPRPRTATTSGNSWPRDSPARPSSPGPGCATASN